jgi:3-deoxy-7-phosphoheptulonate synthase
MIESFIEADNEKIAGQRQYGLSITDPCIDWETTENMLLG